MSDALSQASESLSQRPSAADYSTHTKPLDMAASVEGLLFVSAGPVSPQDLATALEVDAAAVEQALAELARRCADRGLRLQRHAGRVQLTSAPELAGPVERLLGLETTAHLTQAALEVLAVVAYQQPVTRPHIDSVRGVNSDSALRTLLRLGLVDEAGRTEGPGRPILYVTTVEFLQHFGLDSPAALPALELPAAAPAASDAREGGPPDGA